VPVDVNGGVFVVAGVEKWDYERLMHKLCINRPVSPFFLLLSLCSARHRLS